MKAQTSRLKDTLRELGKRGLNLCVISNSYGPRVDELDELIGRPFDMPIFSPASVAPEGVRVSDYRKPNPAMLIRAAQLHGLSIGEVLMVGDQIFKDVLSANRAGAQSLLVPRRGRGDHAAVRWLQRPPEAFVRAFLGIKFPKKYVRGEAA